MLKKIYIKNFAIIDDISIDFESGLNIITGETGSGKTLIITAIHRTMKKNQMSIFPISPLVLELQKILVQA